MDGSDNQRDVELLRERPHDLIVKYQDIIRIIVKKYISSKMFHISEFDDVVQAVNEDVLTKIGKMQSQYNGMALLRTYFSAVVRNSCLKIREKRLREVKTYTLEEEDPIVEENATAELALEYDIKRLGRIFQYFHKKRHKVILCVKLYFRQGIDRRDLLACFPGCSEEDMAVLLQHFEFEYEKMESKEVYRILTPFLNKYEKKENTDDAVRNWTEVRIREIIELLNGRGRDSTYDKETLKILVEKYSSIQT